MPDTARHYIRVVTSFGWTGLNDARRENRNRIVRASTKRSGPDLATRYSYTTANLKLTTGWHTLYNSSVELFIHSISYNACTTSQ